MGVVGTPGPLSWTNGSPITTPPLNLAKPNLGVASPYSSSKIGQTPVDQKFG